MPIQLRIWERRDGADRREIGNTALAMCRIIRRGDGITSSKFYWYGPDRVVMLTEGEAAALDTLGPASLEDYDRAVFELADMARIIMDWRLVDPRAGEESYRLAGR